TGTGHLVLISELDHRGGRGRLTVVAGGLPARIHRVESLLHLRPVGERHDDRGTGVQLAGLRLGELDLRPQSRSRVGQWTDVGLAEGRGDLRDTDGRGVGNHDVGYGDGAR